MLIRSKKLRSQQTYQICLLSGTDCILQSHIYIYISCRLSGAIIDYNRLLYVASELISATCERDGAATGRVQATRSTQSSK